MRTATPHLETSCRTAVRLGVQMVCLEVAAANTAARQLYERSGFCEIARRPRYYGPRKDADALILRLNLSAPVDGIAAAL